MIKHQLDLLPNALDSLTEALAKFELGDKGNPASYKFAVLHMAHFIELFFKYHITQKHPLLIYKDPFAQKLDKNKTIGLWEAVNFINNEGFNAVSSNFKSDLEWLKRLRNEIEHHKFEMDVKQVRRAIGRLFRSVIEFCDDYADFEIESHIPKDALDTFIMLSDEYSFDLREAIIEADKVERENPVEPYDTDAAPVRFVCPECRNYTLVLNDSSATGYKCTFCENEEADELPSYCDICGVKVYREEIISWENEQGEIEDRCYYCSGQHLIDKDD